MVSRKITFAALALSPLIFTIPGLSPCARAGSMSGATVVATSVFDGEAPQQFTFSNITSTRIDGGIFTPWMPGISSTSIEFVPGTANGDETRNELDVNFDGSSNGYEFQPTDTLDLSFALSSGLEFNPDFAALTIANDVQIPSASINGNTLSFDMTNLDQINGNGGQVQYIFDVESTPQFPFSLDDQNVVSGGTSTDPTFSTLTSDSYLDAAGFSGQANDEVDVHGDGAGHDQSVYMNLIEDEYFNINSPTDFTYIAPSKVTFKYAGFANHSTMDVLLKFTTSDGDDPITGQVLDDLVNYINYNNDGTLTAYAYNSDPSDKFPILDAIGSGNYPNSGWDILLQDTDVLGDPSVNLDFSQFSDTGVSAGSLEVAFVGVVPEPGSLVLLAFGGIGLMIRRRKR
jgi:PEP-CTERM motif